MPAFERASNIAVSGGNFSEVHGNVYLGQNPDAEALNTIRKIAENDASFNEFSAPGGSVKLPIFTKDLLLNITGITTDAPSRSTTGSCCFDLAWRLGLLPEQPNSGFMEYEDNIPLARVVTRSTCCCGRISRHGFVHLVSRFFQHASVQETPGGGSSITINTTIGRFKCYEIDDRTFVHFDGSTRSSLVTELVANQDVDHILRVVQGQYLMLDTETLSHMQWRAFDDERIAYNASSSFFGIPEAIVYMPQEKIAAWRLVRDFGRTVLTCTLQYIDTLREPESFCRLVESYNTVKSDPNTVKTETPPEMLSFTLNMCRIMSEKVIVEYEYELFSIFAFKSLPYLLQGHQHYRSPRAEGGMLFKTSQDRFLRMLRTYSAQETGSLSSSRVSMDMETIVQAELQSVMQTTSNNIALVVYQAYIGVVVYWNAARMLVRTREVPTDWIRFVSAEDDYIYLG